MTEIIEETAEIKIVEKKRIRLFSKAWFEQLLNNEATSGLVMIFAMIVAIICANTAAREPVHHFLQTTITLGIGNQMFPRSIEWWVNDILMVFFFLQVGLELKREMKEGFCRISVRFLFPVLPLWAGSAARRLFTRLLIILPRNICTAGLFRRRRILLLPCVF